MQWDKTNPNFERVIIYHYKKKVQVGNYQEMAQSERNSHSMNRGVGKN